MRVDQLYGVNSIADVGITWRGHLPWKLEASVEFGVGRCLWQSSHLLELP